jgi:transposase
MQELRQDQTVKLSEYLRGHPRAYVGEEAACERFLNGVLWMARRGAQWREVPAQYGNWNSVYKRFARWGEAGIWTDMFEHFADDPDLEWVMLDSSIVRAHACAAGASKKTVDRPHKPSVAAAVASAPSSMSPSMHSGIQ